MRIQPKGVFLALVSLFFLSGGFSATVAHVSPYQNVEWIFETTNGYQNILVLRTSLNDREKFRSFEITPVYGILFHAFFDEIPMIKTQMNLGFSNTVNISWSEGLNINNSNSEFARNLTSVTVDFRLLIPKIAGEFGNFFPYVGYSFQNYSYTKSFTNFSDKTKFVFQAVLLGAEYARRWTRRIDTNFYFSFSPFMAGSAFENPFLHFNTGAILQINSSPVAMTVLFGVRQSYEIKNKLDLVVHRFFDTNIGLNFKINLR